MSDKKKEIELIKQEISNVLALPPNMFKEPIVEETATQIKNKIFTLPQGIERLKRYWRIRR